MTLTFSTCILIGAAILYIYYYNRIEKRGGSAGGAISKAPGSDFCWKIYFKSTVSKTFTSHFHKIYPQKKK